VLREAEAGAKTKDPCRKYGVSEPTFYNWKTKYAGLTVSDTRRLKELEAENSKLKKLQTDEYSHMPFPNNGAVSVDSLRQLAAQLVATLTEQLVKWFDDYNTVRCGIAPVRCKRHSHHAERHGIQFQ